MFELLLLITGLLAIGDGDIIRTFYAIAWLFYPVPRIPPWHAHRRIIDLREDDGYDSDTEQEEEEDAEDDGKKEEEATDETKNVEPDAFIKAATFDGKKDGYEYKDGEKGVGYYKIIEAVCVEAPPSSMFWRTYK